LVEVREPRPLYRADGLALLPREPDFAPDIGAFERSRRDDKNEMLQPLRFQRLFDLAPPVASTLERDNVLPDREIALAQPAAQPDGDSLPSLREYEMKFRPADWPTMKVSSLVRSL
jgi:hypothetical protein